MEQEKIILSRVITPRGELQLQQFVEIDEKTHPVYEIIFNGVFLMASYNELSEKELATLAIEPLASERQDIQVLVGGLGIGYSLRAALGCDGIQAVDVVEIEEHIISWAKGVFSELNGYACFDPRVNLIKMDLGDYILKTEKTYDSIILDVDNGPTWLALGSNQRLYEKPALLKIKDLLRHGGVFTVWAAQQCPAFQKRLDEVFGRTELITVQDTDRSGRSTDYFIYRTRAFENYQNSGQTLRSKKLIQKHGFDFRFDPEACTQCQGKCCNGDRGNIFVNSKEIEAISKFLGIEVSKFIHEYLIKISYKISIKEIKTDKNYACIFLDNKRNRCSIYPVRPNQCRTFPFWSYYKDKPEEVARECPGVSLCER
jgi:spermidine synthase/Fe-S-cluster containining protein